MMASAQYSIDGTAIKISATSQTPRHVYVHALSGSLFVNGSSAVTASTGLLIDSGASVVMFQMDSDDELWCISNGGTHVVSVLERYL